MFAVAPTDINWFKQLRTEGLHGDVINFWTPTPWNISRMKDGDNLYFMLKSPIRKIGGYGKFVEYKNMKASEAWKTYGRDNGVENLTHLISRTTQYASKHSKNPIEGQLLFDLIRIGTDLMYQVRFVSLLLYLYPLLKW